MIFRESRLDPCLKSKAPGSFIPNLEIEPFCEHLGNFPQGHLQSLPCLLSLLFFHFHGFCLQSLISYLIKHLEDLTGLECQLPFAPMACPACQCAISLDKAPLPVEHGSNVS